ncbi:MAG: radical SAM protein [Candidatus Moraniibacteriota bacterium]
MLLINTLTGAIDIVPKRILEGKIDSKEGDILNSRGYLIQNDDSLQLERLIKTSQEHGKHVPYWFYVLTTLNCNFACPICYEKKILKNSQISRRVLEDVSSRIKKIQEEKNIPADKMNLIIFGGEPLLVSSRNILNWILETAERNNWKCVIVTNGSRVLNFMKVFERFREVISDFRITIDGPSHAHNLRRPFRGGKGSFTEVVSAVDSLLKRNFQVKVQTILGAGNADCLEELSSFIKDKGWLSLSNFQWRIEGSHDYANLDSRKDEITEAIMVKSIIELWENHPELRGKLKFESFKYLAHLTHSFDWLGRYKTYWGPKFGFCEPQKGFHYVFSTDGRIFHCPRTINNNTFCIGEASSGFSENEAKLKSKTFMEKEDCRICHIGPLCGGGCVVQKNNYPRMDCYAYVYRLISEFVDLMKERILERAIPDQIVSINELWL